MVTAQMSLICNPQTDCSIMVAEGGSDPEHQPKLFHSVTALLACPAYKALLEGADKGHSVSVSSVLL